MNMFIYQGQKAFYLWNKINQVDEELQVIGVKIKLMKIGITGSLSSANHQLQKFYQKKNLFFSADKVVKGLYLNNPFKKKIKNKFRLRDKNIKNQIKLKLINEEISLKELGSVIHPFVRKRMKDFYKKNKKRNYFLKSHYLSRVS